MNAFHHIVPALFLATLNNIAPAQESSIVQPATVEPSKQRSELLLRPEQSSPRGTFSFFTAGKVPVPVQGWIYTAQLEALKQHFEETTKQLLECTRAEALADSQGQPGLKGREKALRAYLELIEINLEQFATRESSGAYPSGKQSNTEIKSGNTEAPHQ